MINFSSQPDVFILTYSDGNTEDYPKGSAYAEYCGDYVKIFKTLNNSTILRTTFYADLTHDNPAVAFASIEEVKVWLRAHIYSPSITALLALKMDKVLDPVAGNIIIMDGDGNAADGGKPATSLLNDIQEFDFIGDVNQTSYPLNTDPDYNDIRLAIKDARLVIVVADGDTLSAGPAYNQYEVNDATGVINFGQTTETRQFNIIIIK